MHVVQTPFRVVRLGDIHTVVIVQHRQRAVYGLGLAHLHRRRIPKAQMLQHGAAFFIGAHFKDIRLALFSIGSPVILNGLQRRVHLIDPGGRQRRIPAARGQHAASSVKTAGFAVILPRNVHQTVRPGQSGQHHVVVIIVDIRDVPGKAEPVPVIFSLCHIGGPFLGKGLRVHQILLHQTVKPLDAFLIAFLNRRINDLPLVRHGEVIRRIAVALSEAIDQDSRVLISVVDNKGHGDDASLNLKFLLNPVRVVPEGDQHLLQLIYRFRHLKSQKIQPLFIDIGNVSDGLDRFLSLAQLLDPGEGVDMAVRGRTHCAVFRILFKNRLQVRHIFVDQVFQRDDDPLLRVT